jgi:hypothetical protein
MLLELREDEGGHCAIIRSAAKAPTLNYSLSIICIRCTNQDVITATQVCTPP